MGDFGMGKKEVKVYWLRVVVCGLQIQSICRASASQHVFQRGSKNRVIALVQGDLVSVCGDTNRGGERGNLEAILSLSKAITGVYTYRLLTDGKPLPAKKLVVKH